jgi:plastocyanin
MPRRMPPTAPTGLVVVLLAAASLLAGCGDEDRPVSFPEGDVRLVTDDYRFAPEVVRTRAGEVTVRAGNEGRLPHALRVMQGERELMRIGTLLPGESGSATERLRPGGYRLVCPIANHEELGMYGQLTVTR